MLSRHVPPISLFFTVNIFHIYPISRATDIMGSKDKCCKPRVNAAADCWNNVRPLGSLSQNRPIHIRGVVERPTLRGCLLRHILAGLSLCSNACPAKRPSLRACCCANALCRFRLSCFRIMGAYGAKVFPPKVVLLSRIFVHK